MKKQNDKHTRNMALEPAEVTGILSVARSGTGFVSVGDGGGDVMVPEESVKTAMPGDKVLVRLDADKSDGRRSGRIKEIVERGAREIVCTLRKTGAYYAAVPMIPNFQHTFHIKDTKGAKEGDRVVVKFAGWDNPMLNPDGEISAIIGPADNPSLDTESIIRMYDLPGEFPGDAEREAETVSAWISEAGERLDLRDRLIITIDPATAKDFDDALSFETDESGWRVLGVHIADVSHFVRQGAAIDAEARKRGTSVYLVDKVIPMLPEQLSNGVCSLMPDEDRLAFSAFLTFNSSGAIAERKFARTIIRSKARLTYEEAQLVIDSATGTNFSASFPDSATTPELSQPVRELVLKLHALAQKLRAKRFARMSLDISSPEMQIQLDATGMMTGVAPAPHFPAHELVEECMIAANEAVAAELSSQRIPYISRFHDAPDEEKAVELSAAVGALGIMAGDLNQPANIVKLLKSVHGTPLQYYVSMLVLRSMKRAEYSVEHSGHFGLAKRFYCHFTSPIRRYPDLETHRQLATLIAGGKNQPTREELTRIAKTSTDTEFNAEQASRDLIEIKKYRFLKQQVDNGVPLEYDAVVVKVMDFGVFVEVPELQVSGMVHVSVLSDKYVRYDHKTSTMSAPGLKVAAGAKLRVFVSGVNFDDRRVDFGVVAKDGSRTARAGSFSEDNASAMKALGGGGGRAASKKGARGRGGRAASDGGEPAPKKSGKPGSYFAEKFGGDKKRRSTGGGNRKRGK